MSGRSLTDVCVRILNECTDLKPEDVCLLLTDDGQTDLPRALEAALRACKAVPLVLGLAAEVYTGDRLPKGVEAILSAVDVILLATKELFPHAARKRAAQAGTRVLSLGTLTPEMVLRACDVDYAELSRVTHAVSDAFIRSSEVMIQSGAGTNVRVEIRHQPVNLIDGLARERGKVAALPAGVVAALPVPETAQGEIVLDASVHSMGLIHDPIHLTVQGGRILDIRGGGDADRFCRLLDAGDENSRCIAEVGVGTNPKARYVGNLIEDERVLGSGHVGFGRNVQLGGTIASNLHIDATMRMPTIYLDGSVIVQAGSLCL